MLYLHLDPNHSLMCFFTKRLFTKRLRESRFRKLYLVHKRTSYCDSKGLTDQRHLTEKLMNKLQNVYGIALEQNVDETVHQLKVASALSAVYFTIALSLIVNT